MSHVLTLNRVLLLPVILFSAGCLDFENQTALFVFVPDRNEIQALFVYEGLYVGESGVQYSKDKEKSREADLKSASDDLSGLVNGERILLGSGYIGGISLKARDDASVQDRQAIEFLKKHIIIRKGFFVTGKAGRFTYCQPITLREPGKLMAWLNDKISEHFAKLEERPEDSIWDADTFLMVQKAAREKHAWLKVERGRFSYTMPATPHCVAKIKREFANPDRLAALSNEIDRLLEKPEVTKADVARWKHTLKNMEHALRILAENPWSLDMRANQLTIALGYGDGEPVRLQTAGSARDTPPRKLEANLLAHARTLGVPFREGVNMETILAEFQRECGGKK